MMPLERDGRSNSVHRTSLTVSHVSPGFMVLFGIGMDVACIASSALCEIELTIRLASGSFTPLMPSV